MGDAANEAECDKARTARVGNCDHSGRRPPPCTPIRNQTAKKRTTAPNTAVVTRNTTIETAAGSNAFPCIAKRECTVPEISSSVNDIDASE